jgi:hypothetical protein
MIIMFLVKNEAIKEIKIKILTAVNSLANAKYNT